MALETTWSAVDTNAEISLENLEALNQVLEQSVWFDINTGLQWLTYLAIGINIVYLLVFILSAIGLYKLSKKLGDRHSWLAFVPLIQLYTYFKTAWYGFWKGLVLLIVNGILAFIVAAVLMMWLGPIFSSVIGSGDMASLMLTSILTTFFIMIIMVVVSTSFLYFAMARRAGQTNTTAILMTLFPWCMLWIVANRISQKNSSIQPGTANISGQSVSNAEL